MISNINEIVSLSKSQQLTGIGTRTATADETARPGEPQDRITISDEAREASEAVTGGIKSEQDLSDEEKQAVQQLKKRDAEVKAHERSHMAAGAGIVQGGASYTYQKGPDGRMYAVGGEVKIDVSPENTPEATIRKMQQVKAAALAPAQPSGTDRAVAAQAAQIEAQARTEQMTASSDEQIDPAGPLREAVGGEVPDGSGPDAWENEASGDNPRQESSFSTGGHIDLIA
jgi:hypothetical protein